MKKKLTVLITAVVMSIAMLLLSSCGLLASYLPDGSTAYDAAVTRGENGSRESWLAGLDSPSTELRRLYEEAKADGSFTGTYYEFLKDLGVSETNGAYVQTALRSAVSIVAKFSSGKRGEDDYYSAGSGVIYELDTTKGDALIITNYHVIYDADSNGGEHVRHISDEITIYLYGGEISSGAIPATYLGGAMQYDIAVLSVEDCPLLKETEGNHVYAKEIVGANTDALTVGEKVYAIGNAEGEGLSVTEGIVSVDAEYIDIYAADGKTMLNLLEIRTDAAVNHGNSGGGLFNTSGELVGIVNARSEATGAVAFGYAIPANLVLSLAQNIIDTCTADSHVRGAVVARLGITAQVEQSRGVFDEATGKMYKEETIVISEISIGGIAYDSKKLFTGDTLVFAKLSSTRGGVPYEREVAITRLYKLTNLLFEVRGGDTLTLTISRGGELIEVEIKYESKDYFTTMQ